MKLKIEIDDQDAQVIEAILATATDSSANSHGLLNLKRLVEMLLEDVVLAVRRPGSWEGANMRQVLRSHGYNV